MRCFLSVRRALPTALALCLAAACVGVPAWKEPRLERLSPPTESLPVLQLTQQTFYEGRLEVFNKADMPARWSVSKESLTTQSAAAAREAGFLLSDTATPGGTGSLRMEFALVIKQETVFIWCGPLLFLKACEEEFTFDLTTRSVDSDGEIARHHFNDSALSKDAAIYYLFVMPFAEFTGPQATTATLSNLYRHAFKKVIEEDLPVFREREARRRNRPAPIQVQREMPAQATGSSPLRGVAIYPFAAKGGASAATAEALGGLLQSEVAANPCVRIVAEDVVRDLAKQQGLEQQCGTESCQIDLARQAQADVLVRGDLLQVGSTFVLTALAVDLASKRTVFSEKVQSDEAGLITATETLARKVAGTVGCRR